VIKVLLLGLVWVGGWMVIVGLGLGGAWFALWSILILVTLVGDVRAHLADVKKREATRRRPMAEYVAGTENVRDEAAPAEVVSDSPSVEASPVAVERPPQKARPAGIGGAGRIDRFPGRCDDVPDPSCDNGIQQIPPEPVAKSHPAQPLDLPIQDNASATNASRKSEAQVGELEQPSVQRSGRETLSQAPPKVPDEFRKETFPIQVPAPEPVISSPPVSPPPMARQAKALQPRETQSRLQDPGSRSLPKDWAQFGQDRLPIRVTALEPVKVGSPEPAPPTTSQFDRPSGRVVLPPSDATILPPQPVRPLGPAADPPRPPQSRSSSAAPRAPRPPRPNLRPEDFQRNAGVPGYLYSARNSEQWQGLHKVGQTRNHPRGRVTQLRQENRDIGDFELLDVVPVVDAYGAEQVLFQVLNELRPVQGREFFLASRSYLFEAMQAAAQFIAGDDKWLNSVYRDLDRSEHPDCPAYSGRYNYNTIGRSPGWVFIARNRFHQADTYRVSASVKRPDLIVDDWNVLQRTTTPHIGFYEVVYALPVANYRKAGAIGKLTLERWKLRGQRHFYRGPLSDLAASLESALQAATKSRA